jgi:hypothetical protein
MAKLTSVIEPLPLLSTDPLVLRARVWTPVGARAAVTFMFPEFVPLSAPILRVPAETLFNSVLVRDSRPETSVPRSITRLLVRGDNVTKPLEDVVARFAPSATSSETTRIWLFAPVVVRAEAEVKEEVLKIMSPAIVFGADEGTEIV